MVQQQVVKLQEQEAIQWTVVQQQVVKLRSRKLVVGKTAGAESGTVPVVVVTRKKQPAFGLFIVNERQVESLAN